MIDDLAFMERAVANAARIRHSTSPNPWVGAVVVALDGQADEASLTEFVKTKLAHYKAPKRILFKDDLGRAVNGKADYKSIKTFVLAELGIDA